MGTFDKKCFYAVIFSSSFPFLTHAEAVLSSFDYTPVETETVSVMTQLLPIIYPASFLIGVALFAIPMMRSAYKDRSDLDKWFDRVDRF